MRLTTLLRSVLRSDGEFTTLARERELLASYLAIERERFEERLEFQINMPAELDNVLLPSLILQPLVENAVKHGIAPSREGGRIVVSATANGPEDVVRITVINTGAPFVSRQPAGDGGVGLQNVERRLRSHYGDRASLTVGRAAGGETHAELRVPRRDAQGTDDAAVTRLRRRAG
jgi:sensor histidine kinase YesM